MLNVKKKSDCLNSKIIIAAIVVVVALGAAYKFMGNGGNVYKDSKLVAKIGGQPIYEAEVENIVKILLANADKPVSYKDLDEKSKTMIVREVAAQKAMVKEARAKGIKEDAEMKRKIHEFKDKLIMDAFVNKFISSEITQEKLQAKYDEIEKSVKGKTQIKASHILLASEDAANKAKELLKKESFAKIAKEMSIDSTTKDRGGELGYLLAGTMEPDFEKAALSLKAGDVSEPVKTKFGWHIIKLEEKKLASVAPFEALKQRIAQDLYSEALKKHADALLADAKIELVEAETAAKPEEKNTEAKQPEKDVKKEVKKEEKKK